jgi:hypothetical protein
MPLTLPDLDDRSFADLVAEGRALIPALAPDWTDHNPADPGITLIELFAWLTEMLLYRVNQVTDANRLAFLRLINGPDWEPTRSVAQEVRDTIVALRKPARAVTAADFERLALEVPGVARAHCLPRRNLELGTRADRASDMPADVSVVIVPKRDSAAPLDVVGKRLEEARLLTTRLHVVAARRVTIAVRLTIHGRSDAVEAKLREQAEEALKAFFDGDGRGWPFGRAVYVSEIYDRLARLPETDYVTPTEGKSELATEPGEAWRLRYYAAGKLEAVALEPDELPVAGGLTITVPPRDDRPTGGGNGERAANQPA